MSLERQEEVRDDAQSAVRAPWQFEWKRPRSSPVKVSASEDKEAEGQCLCMTSAEVSVEELPEYHSNVEKHPFSSLVLTVTIVSSPFCERDNDDVDETGSNNDNKGDLIVLEVTQQPGPLAENDGGESETKDAGDEKEEKEDAHSIQQQQPRMILRKVLRWPGVALKETTTTPEQQQEETWRHHLPVWLGGLPRKRELPETTGVLSACLCRRLLDHDPRTAAALDALDTMTFLSLGMDPELSNHCTSKDKATAPDEEITEEQRQDQMENTATTPSIPELVLACLCSDGSVHVYSPFKLLLKEENGQNHPNRQIDVFANSMSTFLLGDYVFKQLRSSIWPLSQPKATVRLTVPLKKGGGKEGTISSRQKRNTGGNEGEEEEKEDSNSISMWDKSVWDPTVDPFTAIYRTKDNVPTICISAFEYLVIAGRGIQVKARRRRQRQEPTKSRPLLGGFITILSLRHFSEIRTLFLPFAPKQVSPFVWGGMQFLFVLGEQSVAVAIRIDISINNTIVCGEKPSASTWQSRDPNEPLIPTVSSEQSLQSSASNSAMEGRHGRSKNKARAFLHRFQILPILLPQNVADEDALQLAVARLFGSSTFTSPPGLALICPSKRKQEVFVLQRTLEAIDYYKPRDTNLLFQGYRRSRDRRILAISTVQENRHVARITLSRNDEDERPLPSEISTLQKCSNICCHLGQGWCFLGVSNRMYFICWEGATATKGAFVKELQRLVEDSAAAEGGTHGIVTGLLPINPYQLEETIGHYSAGKHLLENFSLPFTGDSRDELSAKAELESENNLIAEAIQSISKPSFEENQHISHREKSIRLLQSCPTWTQLDATKQNRARLELQVPVVHVRLHDTVTQPFQLSLRRFCAENGVATPFYQILSWLSNNKDYFTAASVALDLLRDASTLQHLWRAFDRIDADDERTKLEGLLDGIVPIHDRFAAALDPESDNHALLKATLTQLADMTIGCLTRGGFCMSSTLEYFLQHNPNYNSVRTALVLVATAVQTLSDDKETMLSAMGGGYYIPDDQEKHIKNILWPVRSLLQAGVARDDLPIAMALINAAIPLELRRKQENPTKESMALCISLTKLIIGASPDSIELLLGLTDDQKRTRFWNSLDHETQLELSLILINGKYPMFRQGEVRSWALGYLERSLRGNNSESGRPSEQENSQAPISWLQNLCSSCLVNAQCDIGELMNKENVTAEQTGGDDGLKEHILELKLIRKSLTAGRGSGGLDFGLLVPALLQLEMRKLQWNDDSWVSSQSLLNAACDLAGRVTAEEPIFNFDGVAVMKQCTIAGNVCAGANLVGGTNGLILECCSILMQDCGMTMEQAESFLRQDKIATERKGDSNESEKVGDDFVLSEGHKRVLWLLDQHVLQVRTYGEFDSTPMRGKVDPVFAARVCLRTWYSLTKSQLPSASAWLATWLRKQLGMVDDAISSKRLACAALTRVLVWSTGLGGDYVLGEHLELESKFLVQLSEACWSIVDSVPPQVADELLEQEAADGGSSPLKRTSTSDSYI